ncbi:MAG: response regulator [Deltaproteobacteria bacterium]|nr:response regulator [Deltaproteobacteria bacterium]
MVSQRVLKGKRILLVDDDALIRNSLSMAFRNKGAKVVAAETAEEGLKCLDKGDVDIIISDYRLPGIDGLQFFEKTNTVFPEILKIIITAYGDDHIAREAFRIGVHDYVQKPFSPKTLLGSMARLVGSGAL